jgi:hypothetical protein
MSYVLVTVDFPGVTAQQRTKIYERLRNKDWTKITEPGRDIDTVWCARFADEVTEEAAIKVAIDEFVDCSEPYCDPKLVIQWGPSKPTEFGLI